MTQRRLWLGAAAASLLAAAGTALWLSRGTTGPSSARSPASGVTSTGKAFDERLRLGPAARLVEWDAIRLDELLTDVSRDVLPSVEQRESALNVLAKP